MVFNKPRVVSLMYRQALLYKRHLDRKMDILVWPIIDALMFGAIGTFAASNGGESAVTLMLAGFVMAQLVWQSHIHLSKFFLQEVWDWNVLYLMTRPIRVQEILAASIGTALLVATLATLFIAAISATVFSLGIVSIPLGIILLTPILMLLGWSTALLAMSVVIRLGQKADNLVWAMFGLIGPLSGFIVPVEHLPVGLEQLGLLLPTTHAYEAGRGVLFGDSFPAGEFAMAGFGTLALFGIALTVVAKSMSAFRSRGLISRYV